MMVRHKVSYIPYDSRSPNDMACHTTESIDKIVDYLNQFSSIFEISSVSKQNDCKKIMDTQKFPSRLQCLHTLEGTWCLVSDGSCMHCNLSNCAQFPGKFIRFTYSIIMTHLLCILKLY